MDDGDAARPFVSDELQPLVVAQTNSSFPPMEPPVLNFADSSSEEAELSEAHHKSRKRRRPKELNARQGAESPFQVPWWSIVALALALAFGTVSVWWSKEPGRPLPKVPLWLTTHDTRSAPLDIHAAVARPLVAYLDDAFDTLMDKRHYPCLCMHHIMAGTISNTLYAVCSTVDIRGPLVNPTLVGRGNETDYWTESSSACQTLERGQRRARYRTIWLQWHDVPTGQQMFGRFDGAVAACMQLAMDEMSMGNKVCS